MAAAAALALPLTMQDQSLAVLPVLYTLDQLEQVLNWAEVVVLLKVSSVYHGVWQVLRKRNLLDRAWVVERASFPQQVIYQNLGDYPTLNLSYFSILIIHNYS
jgi:precorrin-2/cobalt-factor-2 C20-methyltransferase